MKLFFASIVFAVFISPAMAADPLVKTRTVKLHRQFSRIILNGDADVVFVKDSHREITIEERPAFENSVSIKNEDGIITIESREVYRGKKPLILIPVTQLESLELNGDAAVATAVMIPSKELRVWINGDCQVQLITSGKVYFDSGPDYHLKYEKKRSRFLPALKD